MRIAFDTKRAYQNNTGLGNYSRILMSSLFKSFPANEYYLLAPKVTELFDPPRKTNIHVLKPRHQSSLLRAAWRSKGVTKELEHLKMDIYHGLSHEIPIGIQHTSIKSVVTMHDLIFERYPEHYSFIDNHIYRTKFSYACKHSNHIIAISQQTKQDLIDIYKISESKITVCYQSCDERYSTISSDEEQAATKAKYDLPNQYFLFVGSVIERKNLLLVCKAMAMLKGKLDIPLVVVGNGKSYLQKVKNYINKEQLSTQVIFLSEHSKAADIWDIGELPTIYQASLGLIYPSIFEGFGLPVLEGLCSRIPVITSEVSSMPEAGGDAAYYIDPGDAENLADAMFKVVTDSSLRESMIAKGIVHALKFSQEACAAQVMQVYQSLF